MSEFKSFRKHILALLGESYGDKTLVLCPTVFVRLLGGDHKAAILLSQILYWSDKTKDPDGWFYKSYADWQTETGLSEAQVRRIVNGDPRVKGVQLTLRDLGVETLLRKVRHTGAPTLHYRINQPVFLARLQAFAGQGNPQQCAGSILNNVQDEPSPLPGMNADQCVPSSDPEIPAQIPSKEISAESSDDDLAIFRACSSRFGKIKDPVCETLSAELARLGADRVGQVLERCALRGRSWHYVVAALANEAAPDQLQEPVIETRWDGADALYAPDGYLPPETPENAPVPVSGRLQTPWVTSTPGATVGDAWSAAVHQMEMQFDRMTFTRCLQNIQLVDFEPETNTFVALASSAYARDMLHHRLKRSVERILSDVYGQPAAAQYLLREEGEVQRQDHQRIA